MSVAAVAGARDGGPWGSPRGIPQPYRVELSQFRLCLKAKQPFHARQMMVQQLRRTAHGWVCASRRGIPLAFSELRNASA